MGLNFGVFWKKRCYTGSILFSLESDGFTGLFWSKDLDNLIRKSSSFSVLSGRLPASRVNRNGAAAGVPRRGRRQAILTRGCGGDSPHDIPIVNHKAYCPAQSFPEKSGSGADNSGKSSIWQLKISKKIRLSRLENSQKSTGHTLKIPENNRFDRLQF